MATGLEALGIRIKPQPWMAEGRCVYGNTPEFLGAKVMDAESGKFLMNMTEFYERLDAAYFSRHDERWTSGSESISLWDAVRECLKCPVKIDCLRHAVADDTTTNSGVAGATTPWERRTIMSERRKFLGDLDREGRIRVLERLVAAKEQGLVRLSTQTDLLAQWLATNPADEETEAAAVAAQVALDADDADDAATGGEVSEQELDRITTVMERAWADMTADDIQRILDYMDANGL